jgi:tRNA threonylcarbamoyladenosine biosynthesis protein TsaE
LGFPGNGFLWQSGDFGAMTLEFFLADATATQTLGRAIGQILRPGAVILLDGELGAGKTTLVQGLAAGLGIAEPVVSPTFVLVNEYLEGSIPLYHFDLYRLSPEEVEPLALEQYWEGGEVTAGIVAIEWSERLSELPIAYLQVALRSGITGRQVRIEVVGEVPGWNPQHLEDLCANLGGLTLNQE